MESLPIDKQTLSLVPTQQNPTISLVRAMLNGIAEHGLRSFTLELNEEEQQIQGYFVPEDPADYASNVGLAACVGQTSVTINEWYKKYLKDLTPSWYLKDEFNNWRKTAIIEFTDFGIACAKELPERDRTGKPMVNEQRKLIKFANPFVRSYGWDKFYQPMMLQRYEQYLKTSQKDGVLTLHQPEVIQAELVVPQQMEDDSWMHNNPQMLSTVNELTQQFNELGAPGALAVKLYKQYSGDYRVAGQTVEANLLREFNAGRKDIRDTTNLNE